MLVVTKSIDSRRTAPEYRALQNIYFNRFCPSDPNPNSNSNPNPKLNPKEVYVCCGAEHRWGKISGTQSSEARCSGGGSRPPITQQ